MIMKRNLIYEECMKILDSKEFRNEFKNFLKPILDYIFEEISIYLFFFVFFILSSFLLHLGVLILLIRYNYRITKV